MKRHGEGKKPRNIPSPKTARQHTARHTRRSATMKPSTRLTVPESTELYRDLFDNANDAIALFELDGTILTVNRGAERLLGWTRAELKGRHYRTVATPATVAIATARERRVLAGEKLPSSTFEAELVRKDGTVVPVEARTRVLRDQAGRPIRYQGIYRDITERKQAERALRESEERYRIVSQSISDYAFSFRIDAHGVLTIEWLTDSFTQITGYTVAELLGKPNPLSIYIHPEDLDQVLHTVRSLPPGTPTTYEFRIIRKDGIVRWLQSRAQAITDAAGHLVRLYGAARDITERKEQETELRQSQRFIQQVADTMPAILLVYDLGEERLVYVNRQIVDSLGYTPEDIRNRLGAELRELVHPDDLRRLTARFAHIMQSGQGEPSPIEYRVRHANGEWRWLRSRETVFRRAGTGTPEQVLGIAQDITTEKRLASLLNEHTKTIDLKAVGRRLLQLRESLGMTQPDFGAYLGVFNQTQISNYERGAAVIPIELLVALRERGHPLEIILGTGMPPLVDETLKYLPASQPRRVLVEQLAEALVRLLKRDRQITEGILRTLELPARELSPEQQRFFGKLTEGET